jgi:hypothetical protein
MGGVGGGNYGRYLFDGRSDGDGWSGYIYNQGTSNISDLMVNGNPATYTDVFNALAGDIISFSANVSVTGSSVTIGAKGSGGSSLSYAGFSTIEIVDSISTRILDATLSDHSNTGNQPILTDTVAGNNAICSGFPTDGSAWINLGGDEETHNFSATINVTPLLTANSTKTTNNNDEIIHVINMSSKKEKSINVTGVTDQTIKTQATTIKYSDMLANINLITELAANSAKNANASGVIEQLHQTQATTTKSTSVSGHITLTPKLTAYFSNTLITIKNFSGTISNVVQTTATVIKRALLNSQINQTTELNAAITKNALLNSEINQQTQQSGSLTKNATLQATYNQTFISNAYIQKSTALIGQLNQSIELSALFLNLAKPLILRSFRINGEIAFQRFNGAIIKQRFDGAIH